MSYWWPAPSTSIRTPKMKNAQIKHFKWGHSCSDYFYSLAQSKFYTKVWFMQPLTKSCFHFDIINIVKRNSFAEVQFFIFNFPSLGNKYYQVHFQLPVNEVCVSLVTLINSYFSFAIANFHISAKWMMKMY